MRDRQCVRTLSMPTALAAAGASNRVLRPIISLVANDEFFGTDERGPVAIESDI